MPKAIAKDALQTVWDAIVAARKTPGTDLERLQAMLQDQADSLWLADYRANLSALVDELRGRTKTNPDTDLSDAIHETVDGSGFIIYNQQAAQVLRLSGNEDAYDHENGESGASVNVRALYAMEADLREAIEEAGGDPSAPTLGEALPPEDDPHAPADREPTCPKCSHPLRLCVCDPSEA